MLPNISGGIDHIHIYCPDREEGARWYQGTLGFTPDPAAEAWARDPSGPLTLQDISGAIHLALFRSAKPKPQSFAFGVSGTEYEAWKAHLEAKGLALREADHALAWSFYLQDPYGNQIEFTTYDHDHIRERR